MGDPGSSRGGFTLIEVLISLSILALVAAGLSLSFRMTARSMEQGEEAVHASVRQRARFSVLERAFRAASSAPIPTDNGVEPYFRGERNRLSFLSASPKAATPGGAFRLLAFREGRLPTGEQGLLISERAPFSANGVSGGEGDAGARVVFPGATGVAFFYVSGFSAGGTMETESAWDIREKQRLPVAVGIEFLLEGESEKRRIVVPLPIGINQLPDKRPTFDAGPIG